jgi:hypothetical protein
MPRSKGKVVKAWHFIINDKLRDGRDCLPDGKTISLKKDEVVSLCRSGFHGSESIVDAISYGAIRCHNNEEIVSLCRVEIWGDLTENIDKLAGRHRKILWRIKDIRPIAEKLSRKITLHMANEIDKDKVVPESITKFLKTGKSFEKACKDLYAESNSDLNTLRLSPLYYPIKKALTNIFRRSNGHAMSILKMVNRSYLEGQFPLEKLEDILLKEITKHAPKVNLKSPKDKTHGANAKTKAKPLKATGVAEKRKI